MGRNRQGLLFPWIVSVTFRTIVLSWICTISSIDLVSAEFFVAPNGTGTGDGSFNDPWDLQTALNQPAIVTPGDVIWLRGGVYHRNNEVTKFTSNLSGAPAQPITVRQFPGERATIDGRIFQSNGGWVNYWGFEIMNSYSNRVTSESGPFPTAFQQLTADGRTEDLAAPGFDIRAPHIKLINLAIHDSIGGGISVWTNAIEPELYGNLIYHNGWQGCDRGHGHGLYIQSLEPSTAKVSDCLFFANLAYGIHATSDGPLVDNVVLEKNAVFFNGVLARRHQGNLLVGPFLGPARNPVLTKNFIYDRFGTSSDVNLGYSGGMSNAVVQENYFQTSVRFSENNEGLNLTNNTFLSNTLSLMRSNFPDNLYLNMMRPANNVVQVLTNKYDSGRAHVIVYNWENAETVAIDASSFLLQNLPFEVRNAQDYFGAPVLRGIFNGGFIELPMNNLPVSKPLAMNCPVSTGPEFNVFIIQPYVESINLNEAPVISAISDQTISQNYSSETISFEIQDTETSAEYLNLSVHCSNPTLVSNKNIQISGTGSNRLLTIVPQQNATGTANITLTVSDGFLNSSSSFNIAVIPGEPPPTTNQLRATLSIALLQTDISIRLNGVANADYSVQASTNLINWTFIGTISTDCAGLGFFSDAGLLDRNQRFFRARRTGQQ